LKISLNASHPCRNPLLPVQYCPQNEIDINIDSSSNKKSVFIFLRDNDIGLSLRILSREVQEQKITRDTR